MKCINYLNCYFNLHFRNELFPTNKSFPTGLKAKHSYPTFDSANPTTQ